MKNQSIGILLALTLTFSSFSARAEYVYFSGNTWIAICGNYPDSSELETVICEMYTKGVIEGFYWGYKASQSIESNVEGAQIKPFCIEPIHTESQHIRVIAKFMNENPEVLHRPAPWLIHAAMNLAFPCVSE